MEIRDLYDRNGNSTGETIFKDEEIPKGRYIKIVLVFIQNSEGKFLIQKRSKEKNGLYATTGGHAKTGEDEIMAILTEVNEELGITLNRDNLIHYYSGISDEERVLWYDYYVKMDIDDIDSLNIQKEEVESLHWFTKDEIIRLNDEKKFFINHYGEFESLLEWFEKKEKNIE